MHPRRPRRRITGRFSSRSSAAAARDCIRPLRVLARLLVESPDEEAAHQTAERLYDVVRTYLLSHPVQKKRTLMLRADEAPVKRIRGQYRYHVLMKLFDHPDASPLLALLAELAGVQDGACTIYCEVNPATMM